MLWKVEQQFGRVGWHTLKDSEGLAEGLTKDAAENRSAQAASRYAGMTGQCWMTVALSDLRVVEEA